MKNKKLLILLCIPLIISVMVLPLCSFTTVYNTDYERYSTYTNAGIGYAYDYGSTGTYYGILQNSLSVLVGASANTLNQKNSSIKFTASDYYITSSSRISIGDPYTLGWGESGVLSEIPASSPYFDSYDYFASLLYSTNNGNTYFTGEFWFDNYRLEDNIGIDFYMDGQHFSMTNQLFDLQIEFDIAYLYNEYYDPGIENQPDYEITTYSYEHIYASYNELYDWPTFYIDEFVEQLINSNCNASYDNMIAYEITNLHFHLKPYFRTIDQSDGQTIFMPLQDHRFSRISLRGNVVNLKEENRDGYITQILGELFGSGSDYSLGFSQGYNKGLAVGHSSAESVWGSFTTFLTETVGGFLDMNITPTITISNMLGIILSVTLVVAFLKIFAGG